MNEGEDRRPDAIPIPVLAAGVALAAAILVAALVTGIQHDHSAYVRHWQAVLSGGDPWGSDNAYGPLHNPFAFLFALWPLLPKLSFVVLALVSSWALFVRTRVVGIRAAEGAKDLGTGGARRFGTGTAMALVAAVFALNPAVVLPTYVYGQNDIVAAALILAALFAREADRPGLAGFWIGLAALEKFYPLLLAAFMALEAGRVIRLRPLATAVVTFAIGMTVSHLLWGPSTWTPLMVGAIRVPKMLSVYRFFMCHPAVVGGEAAYATLVETNSLVVIGAAGTALLFLHRRGVPWARASTLGLAVIFLTYKVGHPQFYVTWLVLLGWLLTSDDREDRGVGRALIPIAVAVAAFQILYAATGAMTGQWTFLRCYVSLPFVAVALLCLVLAIRRVSEPPKESARRAW